MDKYKSAIIEHERCRKEIVRLTSSICTASGGDYDDRGKQLGESCSNYKGSFHNKTTCIERYWQNNKDEREGGDTTYEIEPLCPSCSEVDRLIIERKEVKQKFGVAKRRIGQIARGLLKC